MIYGMTFEVISTIPLNQEAILNVKGTKIELKHKEGILAELIISKSIPVRKGNYAFQGTNDRGQFGLVINRDMSLYREFIEKAQQIESYLGYNYGLRKIKWECPQEIWMPENEEEKKKILVNKWQLKPEYADIKNSIDFKEFEYLINEQKTLSKFKIPLSFFREGQNYYNDFRYIDAFNYFYLALESIYGNGKQKTKDLIEEFKNSKILKGFIENSLKGLSIDKKDDHIEKLGKLADSFRVKDWKNDIFAFLTKVRGFLHHHTLKCSMYANPFENGKYHSISLLLMATLVACLYYEIKTSIKLRKN